MSYTDELVATVTRALDWLAAGGHGPGSVLDARQALDDLGREVTSARADYLQACQQIADMHAAATGRVGGPRLGVVEDIAELRSAGQHLADYLVATPQPDHVWVDELIDRWNRARGAYPEGATEETPA